MVEALSRSNADSVGKPDTTGGGNQTPIRPLLLVLESGAPCP